MTNVNTKEIIPYSNFKYLIFFEEKKEPVAGMNKMSVLKRTNEILDWRMGGNSNTAHNLAGKTKYEPITFESGLSLDSDFEDWAQRVNNLDTQLAENDNNFKREMNIEILYLDRKVVLRYNIHSCWVSEYIAISDFDTNSNAILIQHLKLENEGWSKDKNKMELS